MRIAGIIAEYNPFHNGHMRHIEETKRLLGPDTAIICVMSGNFVQRGEPAVINCHARAEAAVRCGADLVIELPPVYSVSAAGDFAMGAVSVLNSLGVCGYLSFGSESGSIEDLKELARCVSSPEIEPLIRKELSGGISYPSAQQRAAEKLMGDKARLLLEPNNLLGIEYIKAVYSLNADIEPVTIARKAPHAGGKTAGNEAAAADIRRMLFSEENPEAFLPEESMKIIKRETEAGRGPVSLYDLELPIMTRLRTMGDDEFSRVPGTAEGLDARFRRYARTCSGTDEIISMTKTKRYTESRIRRMVMCAFLGIEKGQSRRPPEYAGVLAFNEAGREILREIKSAGRIPVITKPAEAKKYGGNVLRDFKAAAAATDLYVLAYKNPEERGGGSGWRTGPVTVW